MDIPINQLTLNDLRELRPDLLAEHVEKITGDVRAEATTRERERVLRALAYVRDGAERDVFLALARATANAEGITRGEAIRRCERDYPGLHGAVYGL